MKKTPNEDDHRLIFFMGEISLDEVFTPAVVLSAMLYFHHKKFTPPPTCSITLPDSSETLHVGYTLFNFRKLYR